MEIAHQLRCFNSLISSNAVSYSVHHLILVVKCLFKYFELCLVLVVWDVLILSDLRLMLGASFEMLQATEKCLVQLVLFHYLSHR